MSEFWLMKSLNWISAKSLMRDLADIQFGDLIIKIHSLTGFCLKNKNKWVSDHTVEIMWIVLSQDISWV